MENTHDTKRAIAILDSIRADYDSRHPNQDVRKVRDNGLIESLPLIMVLANVFWLALSVIFQ